MQIELFIYWPSHSPPPTFSLHFLGATVPFAGAPWQQRDSSMRRRLGEVKFLMMSPNHVAKDETQLFNFLFLRTLCCNVWVLNWKQTLWERSSGWVLQNPIWFYNHSFVNDPRQISSTNLNNKSGFCCSSLHFVMASYPPLCHSSTLLVLL